MAVKNNYLKKNKDSVFGLLGLLVLFLLLSLVIPAIGVGPSSPALWVSVVDFFISIQNHFTQFWMFYTFVCVVVFGYYSNSKK